MALATSGPETLPNLKIQVDNDLLDEAMDVDEEKKDENSGAVDSELEEGEISDSKEDDFLASHAAGPAASDLQELPDFERRYENKSGAFVTGIDIFSKDGQEKLNVRAKRFGLDPSQVKPLNAEQLLQLHESLGITDTEESALEKQGYRLDALHIRGTDNMSTQDVFDYFKEYGPASIEWINDVSCNVVWLDKASPARALLGVSRPISGLTQTGKRELEEVVLVQEDEDSDEEEMAEAINTSQPVAADTTQPMQTVQDDTAAAKVKDENSIPASEIDVPIPPGYWRLGTPCSKAKFILLRYCTRHDRKPKQAEKMSEYYKKYGNPNYGGIRGIISTSRKRRYQSDRRRSEPEIYEDLDGSKNPWGSLAQNWGTMDRSHTKPGFFDPDDPLLLDKPKELRTILRSGRSNPPPPPPTLHSSASDSEALSLSSDDDSKWRKRLKGPHMRMYADDEEKKVEKRKKLTARLGKRSSPPLRNQGNDLRSRLSQVARPKLTRGSVWTRLEAARTKREVEIAEPSAGEWSTEGEEEEEDDTVVTTVRSQVNDLRHTLGNRKTKDEGDDLRSKLNQSKSKKDKKVSSPKTTSSYNKSPLRIEINNDEYCGGSASGSGSSSGSSTGSGSSSGSSSSSSSSSESGSASSDEEEQSS